jgi:hypothetical protein
MKMNPIRKPETRTLGRSRHKGKDDIKVDLYKIGCRGMD